jgi:hypothetical protein
MNTYTYKSLVHARVTQPQGRAIDQQSGGVTGLNRTRGTIFAIEFDLFLGKNILVTLGIRTGGRSQGVMSPSQTTSQHHTDACFFLPSDMADSDWNIYLTQ